MSFLLDTDICSAYLKGDRRVQNRFLQYGGRLHISAIMVGELFAGVLSTRASPRLLPSLHVMIQDLEGEKGVRSRYWSLLLHFGS